MAHFLDIIIPEYNCPEEFIKRLLNSINIQKGVDFKEIGIIIVNDHSPKRLRKGIFRNYPKLNITYLIKETNEGTGMTRQTGLDNSSAFYVTFVDQDDVLYGDDTLGNIINVLKINKYQMLITSYIEEIKQNNGCVAEYIHKNDYTEALHGVFIDRSVIVDNNLRFMPGVRVHDDSYFRRCAFNVTFSYYMDIISYVWKYNPESQVRMNRKYSYLVETYDDLFLATKGVQEFLDERMIGSVEYTVDSILAEFIILESNLFNFPELSQEKEKKEKELYELIAKNSRKFQLLYDKIDDHFQMEFRLYSEKEKNLCVLESFDSFIKRMSVKYPNVDFEYRKCNHLLDIIVPYYDIADDTIRRLINSVKKQTRIDCCDIGFIFVSDKSPTDIASSIINEEYPMFDIKYYRKEKNEKQGLTRQYGLDRSTADWVTFVDQDDLLYGPNSLFDVVRNLKTTDYNILVTDFYRWNEEKDTTEYMTYKELMCLHGVFYKRQSLVDGGFKFHDKIWMCEDNYFCLITNSVLGFGHLSIPTYIWVRNKDTQSSKGNRDGNIMTKIFDDYIIANTDAARFIKDKGINASEMFLNIFMDLYVLSQSDIIIFENKKMYEKKIYDYYLEFEHLFNNFDDEYKTMVLNKNY